MPETVTPTPAPKAPQAPVASKADQKKADREAKKRERKVEDFREDLADAQAEVAEVFGEVKSVLDKGEPVNLTPLTAAIDNLTDAVGNITAHGARNSWLSNDESKQIRDNLAALTQAYSDFRTNLEFPSMATETALLDTVIENLNTALSDAQSSKNK